MTERKENIEAIINHRAIDRIYPSREALEESLKSGRRFKIYLGVDATGPHIHLGHLTNFLVLKQFQNLGAEVVFLIGDFTAMIGDPTDKAAARIPLTAQQIKENYKTFEKQAGRILRLKGKNAVEVAFNSKWLAKMDLADMLDLAGHFTVQQMIERDMFQVRIRENKPIGLHEFLYPLLQGYDSVAMEVDAEIGGTDQTFNMLAGRTLLKDYKGKEKFVLTTRLLVDPKTGKKIMNKSEGGLINLDDEPDDMFGKIMSLKDETIMPLAELCTELAPAEILSLGNDLKKGANPRDIKARVSEAIVETVYGKSQALSAKARFEQLFSRKEIPTELPELKVKARTISAVDLAVATGVIKSKSEARRLIEQGGFDFDGKNTVNPQEILKLKGGEMVRVGKKSYFRVSP